MKGTVFFGPPVAGTTEYPNEDALMNHVSIQAPHSSDLEKAWVLYGWDNHKDLVLREEHPTVEAAVNAVLIYLGVPKNTEGKMNNRKRSRMIKFWTIVFFYVTLLSVYALNQ